MKRFKLVTRKSKLKYCPQYLILAIPQTFEISL